MARDDIRPTSLTIWRIVGFRVECVAKLGPYRRAGSGVVSVDAPFSLGKPMPGRPLGLLQVHGRGAWQVASGSARWR